MPAQTTKKTHIFFPDGAMVEIQKSGSATWLDVGALNSDISATLEWEENLIETANAGPLDKVIREMTMSGSFTLINLDPEGVEALGGGVFELVTTNAAEVVAASSVDQIIAAGWDDGIAYPIVWDGSAAVGQALKFSAAPVLTSVTLDPGDADEALSAWSAVASGDYTVIADPNSGSGYSIIFNSASMATGTPKTKTIAIVFGDNTPVGSTTLYAGSSNAQLSAYAMRVTHTDSNSKIRRLELYAVDAESGGFAFGFKGANSDGVEEMPLSFKAKLDTTRTDGRQLMAWTIEVGAA